MYNTIIVPVDLSDTYALKLVIPVALNFVNCFGSELHLINIIPDIGISMLEEFLPTQWIGNQKGKHLEQLNKLVEQYIPMDMKVKQFVGRGHVYDEIINYSNSVKANLLIVPAIRPQLQDYMLGPNVSKIVRHAKISVLVVRE